MRRPHASSSPRAVLVALALPLFVGFPRAEAQSPPSDDPIEKAIAHRKSNQYDVAIRLLEQAIAASKDEAVLARGRFELGQTIFSRAQAGQNGEVEGVEIERDLRRAIAVFEEVLGRHPQSEQAESATYMTGSSYMLLEDLAQALASYTRAYERYPQSDKRMRALLRMGVCEAGLGRADKARAIYQQVLRAAPRDGADAVKARKYLTELSLVGTRPSLHADEWLLGAVGEDGLATFEGQVVVVVFFATWCNHCSENMPRLRSLIAEWYPRGVVFLGVANPEDPENTSPVDVYVQRNRIDFVDVALDRQWHSWRNFKVGGLPAAAVIDGKGIVRWRGNLSFLPGSMLEALTR